MAIYNTRIKELRLQYDFTLKEIANKLGITEATAQRYESGNGIKSIPYERIVQYADIFDVTPEYIMGWKESEEKNYKDIDTDKMFAITDPVLVEYAYKISKMDDTQKAIIFGMIDQMSK